MRRGQIRHDGVGLGKIWMNQVGLGEVWSGAVRQGTQGRASLGMVRFGPARQGMRTPSSSFYGEFLVGVSVRFQDFADYRLAGNQDRNVVGRQWTL